MLLICILCPVRALAEQVLESTSGYSLTLPEGWRKATATEYNNLIDGAPNANSVDLIALTDDQSDGFSPKISVVISPTRIPIDKQTQEGIEDAFRSKIINGPDELKRLTSSIRTIGQTRCIEFEIEVLQGQQFLVRREFLIPFRGQSIFVSCGTTESMSGRHLPQFEAIVASFRIAGANQSETGSPSHVQLNAESSISLDETKKRVVTGDGYQFELIDGWQEYSEEEYALVREQLQKAGVAGLTEIELFFYDSKSRDSDRLYARIVVGTISQTFSLTEEDRVAFQEGLVSSYPSRGANVVVHSSEIVTVGQHECIKIVFEVPVGEYQSMKEMYVYPAADKTYRFTCTCLASKYAEYKLQFDAIMSSVSIQGYTTFQQPNQSAEIKSGLILTTIIVTVVAVVVAIALAVVFMLVRSRG